MEAERLRSLGARAGATLTLVDNGRQVYLRVNFGSSSKCSIALDIDRALGVAYFGYGAAGRLEVELDESGLARIQGLIAAITQGLVEEHVHSAFGATLARDTVVLVDGVPDSVREGLPLVERLPGARLTVQRLEPWLTGSRS